tara:strand:+ start:427 stop:2559 length:2133 start_codon:yes stop_codon:yes gene_type:complete
MKVVAWDVETHLIEPGNLTPRLVCLSASGGMDTRELAAALPYAHWFRESGGEWEAVVTREYALDFLLTLALGADKLVAHNGSFDWGVMCNEFPELLGIHAALVEQGKVADTRIRETLIAIAEDNFVFDARTGTKPLGFSLAHCVLAHFGVDISDKKSKTDARGNIVGDASAWRLRYSELDGVPIDKWPEEAITYAAEDSLWTRRVYRSQAHAKRLPEGTVVSTEGEVVNEREQLAADWALHAMACHGVYTDLPAVQRFQTEMKVLVKKAETAGRAAGFIVINRCKSCDGTGKEIGGRACSACGGLDHEEMLASGGYGMYKNGKPKTPAAPKTKKSSKRLRLLVDKAYGGHPPLTDKGAVKTDADTLVGSGNPLLEEYAEGSFAIKMLDTYYPILLRGVDTPITSSPNVLVRSGRTSWRRPNWQNPPQQGGFRSCVVPREGKVFASIDYSTLELCTLAQVCLNFFGQSDMAEAINSGRDLHLDFAARMLGITYEEARQRKSQGDEQIKEYRQRAKVANFGFPGGLGVDTLVEYAKGYGLDMSFNQADDLKKQWTEMWPETQRYFRMVSDACDASMTGRFVAKQLGSGRLRGGCSYTSGCNTYFQGLAADGAKAAMWALHKACYLDRTSPLYGVRMWAFIHDEFMFEGPEGTVDTWATEATRIMVEAMSKYVPEVRVGAEPAAMRRWSKHAVPAYDSDGRLIPYEDAIEEAA